MPTVSRILVALAVACFIGAVALTPSEVRSHATPPATPAAIDEAPAAFPSIPLVVPDGDPFVARVTDDDERPAAIAAPVAPFSLARIGPLPANAGAAGLVAAWGTGLPIVRAIVTGAQPRALVDDGTTTRLVRVGDRVGTARVSAIDASGLRLDDGSRLHLPANDAALR